MSVNPFAKYKIDFRSLKLEFYARLSISSEVDNLLNPEVCINVDGFDIVLKFLLRSCRI